MKTQLTSPELTVIINHSGAELSSVKNKAGIEFMWQADKNVWPRHAPVLFPIVGKVKNNQYLFEGKTYEIGQHGFARDMDFVLKEKNPDACTFTLSSTEETKLKFPFDFILEITYRLEGEKLLVKYTVINPSENYLYFNIGAHPGFKCPLLPGETFGDYCLEFESNDLRQTPLNNGHRVADKFTVTLRDKKLPLSSGLFDNDALVFEGLQINKVTLCSEKNPHKISMYCRNWPYFGIWTKKGCNEFICLEPWHGITDAEESSGNLEQKDGIIRLSGKKSFDCSYSISFS